MKKPAKPEHESGMKSKSQSWGPESQRKAQKSLGKLKVSGIVPGCTLKKCSISVPEVSQVIKNNPLKIFMMK